MWWGGQRQEGEWGEDVGVGVSVEGAGAGESYEFKGVSIQNSALIHRPPTLSLPMACDSPLPSGCVRVFWAGTQGPSQLSTCCVKT